MNRKRAAKFILLHSCSDSTWKIKKKNEENEEKEVKKYKIKALI
jgi:hypothetical protein